MSCKLQIFTKCDQLSLQILIWHFLFWFSVSINTILLPKKSERWKACCLSWFLVSWLWVMPGTRKKNLQSEHNMWNIKVIILRRGPRATPTVKFWWLNVRKWHEILLTLFLWQLTVMWVLYFKLFQYPKRRLNSPIFTLSHSRTGQRFDFSSCLVPAASRLSRMGWFSRALAFRSLYYPWGKMGTTRNLLVITFWGIFELISHALPPVRISLLF